MSLSININLPDGEVNRAVLDIHLDALGFTRYPVMRADNVDYGKPEEVKTGTNLSGSELTNETTVTVAEPRERGKPSGGRARRTKEEIAEDEAAEKAEATAQGISTGENRTAPDDNPEADAQDAADEAAEAAAGKPAEVTVDDLRDVMGEYVKKFTMEATQEDGVKIFADALGTPPNGESGWKLSSVVAAGRVGDAVAAWREAVAASKRFGA